MRLIILNLVISFSSCAKVKDFVNHKKKGPAAVVSVRDVDPAFESLVQAFENLMSRPINFKVSFEKLSGKRAGLCSSWDDGKRLVQINPMAWDISNYNQKKQLIFHELGHCALGKGHAEGFVSMPPDNYMIPKSIMRSYMFNEEESRLLDIHNDYYIDELFKN